LCNQNIGQWQLQTQEEEVLPVAKTKWLTCACSVRSGHQLSLQDDLVSLTLKHDRRDPDQESASQTNIH